MTDDRRQAAVKPRVRVASGAAAALLAVLIASPDARGQSAGPIDVTGSRPLWGALDALETMLGVPINYEDPPYENAADLQTSPTLIQRLGPVIGRTIAVPRAGRVAAQIPVPTAVPAPENEAVYDVGLLLASYRQSGLPGDFKVEQANGITYVTPVQVLGADGTTHAVTSPMMAPVTIPFGRRNAGETVHAIFEAVSAATGLRIGIGSLPFLPVDMVGFGATGEPARDALARLLVQAGRGPCSYRLLFDPRPRTRRPFDYIINIHRTGYAPARLPTSFGPSQGSPTPSGHSGQPTGNSPAFVTPKR